MKELIWCYRNLFPEITVKAKRHKIFPTFVVIINIEFPNE